MGAIGRFVTFAVRAALLVAALGLAAGGVAQLGGEEADPPAGVLFVGAAIALVVRALVKRVKGPGSLGATTAPATIMRIWQDPRPGAPAVYWTYVLFDARGDRVKVHLSKSQARTFLDRYSAGDVGRLTYRGDSMINWDPPTAARPMAKTRVSAFISYERSWSEDAQYVAQFLQSRGVDVWIDTDELRAGDALTKRVVDAILASDIFIPLLSMSYWTSQWCLRELETARGQGLAIRPVKVEGGRLVPPPHLRREIAPILDDAVYVDLRGREPIIQLEDFTASLSAGR